MKRIFLSLPMSGRSDKEIMEQIKEMKAIFLMKNSFERGEEIEFEDNTDCPPIDSRDTVTPPLLYLGEAIRKMAYCDGVLFAEDYALARGCLIEEMVAKHYGIDTYYISFSADNGEKIIFKEEK